MRVVLYRRHDRRLLAGMALMRGGAERASTWPMGFTVAA
jgi:hypothetical protein